MPATQKHLKPANRDQLAAGERGEVSPCPLCKHQPNERIDQTPSRDFYRCHSCYMVYVPAAHHLSPDDEKAIYDYHENEIEDAGYRLFLSRLATPLLEKLKAHSRGLDFGCGPGPALAAMLEEQGHEMSLYDLYYRDTPEVLGKRYDFITCTEVLEHLREPESVLEQLTAMLAPGAYLGVMTKLMPDLERFSQWHYARDLTHICFYDRRTFAYIAKRFGFEFSILRSDVILLRKI